VNLTYLFVKVGGRLIQEVVIRVLLIVSVALEILYVLIETHGRIDHHVFLLVYLLLFVHGHGLLVILFRVLTVHGVRVVDPHALHFLALDTKQFTLVFLLFVQDLVIDLLDVLKSMRIVLASLVRSVNCLVALDHRRKGVSD
jgi:hypothetical protein